LRRKVATEGYDERCDCTPALNSPAPMTQERSREWQRAYERSVELKEKCLGSVQEKLTS
jgi:hypothetical protein